MSKRTIRWNPVKDQWLQENHQISCKHIANAVENDQVIKIETHPNQKKYPNQKLIYVKHHNYIYIAPCVIKEKDIFIKTIYASRKATKLLLKRNI